MCTCILFFPATPTFDVIFFHLQFNLEFRLFDSRRNDNKKICLRIRFIIFMKLWKCRASFVLAAVGRSTNYSSNIKSVPIDQKLLRTYIPCSNLPQSGAQIDKITIRPRKKHICPCTGVLDSISPMPVPGVVFLVVFA
jgi:hypothetical protein